LVKSNTPSTFELTEIDPDGKLVRSFGNDGTYDIPLPIHFSLAGRSIPMGDYIYSFGQSRTAGLATVRVVLPIFNNGFE
jgi:hypothetical protein